MASYMDRRAKKIAAVNQSTRKPRSVKTQPKTGKGMRAAPPNDPLAVSDLMGLLDAAGKTPPTDWENGKAWVNSQYSGLEDAINQILGKMHK